MRGIAIVLSLVLAPVAAVAQVGDPAPAAGDPMVRAREVYQVGVDAYNQQFYGDAEKAFREVYDLIHSPEVLFDISLCLEKERKWGPAAATLETYLRDSHKVKDRHKLEKRIDELKGRAARQEEMDAAINSGKPAPHEVATSPGNEVMKMGSENEDGLLGFGEASGEEQKPAATTNNNAVVEKKVDSGEGQTPVYKKWWLWTAVAAAVIVVAVVVIAVEVAGSGTPAATTFGDIGPGAHGLLLRF